MSVIVDEVLVRLSGRDRAWWVYEIQRLISQYSEKTSDPNHDHTNVGQWLTYISQDIQRRVDQKLSDGEKIDENIVAARIMALATATWAARVTRAKSYDPRRPIENRKQAMVNLQRFQLAMAEAMSDESLDHKHFPGQEWDPPFAPNAKNGDFV